MRRLVMSHDFRMTDSSLQQKMASAPRAHLSRILGLALRSRAAAIRPPSLACASRWRYLSAAPCLALNSQHRAEMRGLNLTGTPRLVLPVRGFASEGITVQELEERVVNVLKLFDKVNPDKVTVDAHFMNDLGMDSLDAVEVVMAFEDEFGVEISDEEAEKIFSCKDAIELLKTKMNLH